MKRADVPVFEETMAGDVPDHDERDAQTAPAINKFVSVVAHQCCPPVITIGQLTCFCTSPNIPKTSGFISKPSSEWLRRLGVWKQAARHCCGWAVAAVGPWRMALRRECTFP